MAKNNFDIDRLSDRISTILPEFIQEDAPVFELFLKSYFEFLEAEILVLSDAEADKDELDKILLEDSTGGLLVEPATVNPTPDADISKLIYEQDKEPFRKGNYIVGSKTGTVAKIKTINDNTFYVETIHGLGFDKGEKITNRQGGITGVVKSFKHNTILANNRLLDYSDVDQTTEEFLDYFQKDFIPSLDLDDTKDPRLTIKNISDLYQTKGTTASLEFLMRLLYGQDAEVRYPINGTIQVSESGYNDQRRIAVVMDDINTIPSATDKVIQYEVDGITIKAEAIVENVYIINSTRAEFSLEITNNHFGTFLQEHPCELVDRDGVTKVNARVKGILVDYDETQSSTYLAQDDLDSILLESPQLSGNITTSTSAKDLTGASSKFLSELKVGDTIKYKVGSSFFTDTIATITDDLTATLTANASGAASNADYFNESYSGGLLTENQSFGSMYSLNDKLVFSGGKSGRDEVKAEAVIDGLRKGGVEKVFIEAAGTGYQGGDIVIFDNSSADGNAAEAVIGAIEDVAILENKTQFGQFQFTATAGQTLFTGDDINGQRMIFNDNSVRVFVNGVEKTHYTDFTFKNDRVTFTSGQTAGHTIEVFTEFNNILMEDGDRLQLNTTESHIRSVTITSPGSGYTTLPQCFPGGYIYFSDLSGYLVGETIQGGTSNATATIVRINEDKGRLEVKRTATDTGQFTASGENILGGTSSTNRAAKQIVVSSGTGAKLLAYSDEIGGVGSINIQDQGYNFKEDQTLDSSSFHKMLISTPTANLLQNLTFTGRITGSTGRIVSFNPNTQVLTFDNLSGSFLDNEQCLFNSSDTFKVLKFNPFQARGKLGGEGIIQKQLVTNESTLDESASNLHDNKFYQTHSYVVKVGESINKWRSIVKDLVHPSGHIFFGEVAVKEFVNPHDIITNEVGLEREQRFNFIPTIIMQGFPTYHIDLEGPNSTYRDDESNIIYENGFHMILEEAPDINAITSIETLLMIYTNAADVNSPLVIYQPTDESTVGSTNPTAEDFKQRHINIQMIKSLANASVRQTTRTDTNPKNARKTVTVENNGIRNVYVINGVRQPRLDLQRGYTYYISHPSAHPFHFSTTSNGTHAGGSLFNTGVTYYTNGLTVIQVDSNTPDTLYYYCQYHTLMGAEVFVYDGLAFETTINIDNVDNPSHSPYEKRASLFRSAVDGIVLPSYPPFEQESIVYEDDSRIIIDEGTYNLRGEADDGDGLGFHMIFEDGSKMEMETGSFVAEDIEYLGTERVQNTSNIYHIAEDGARLTLEDGSNFVNEGTGGNSITTFIPVGNRIEDLNKIGLAQTFDIAYYLVDEDVSDDAEEDRIVLEDGYGSVLLESSKSSGLSFIDMDSYLPNFRMKSFDELANIRTNIAYSTYVKSSKIKNSTLSSL